ETQLDPTHTDFLKLRRGDDVWDVSAGLAPRLRDTMRFLAAFGSPDFKDNLLNAMAKAGGRTLSPGLKTPIQVASTGVQTTALGRKVRGPGEEKKRGGDYVANVFNGMEDDG